MLVKLTRGQMQSNRTMALLCKQQICLRRSREIRHTVSSVEHHGPLLSR